MFFLASFACLIGMRLAVRRKGTQRYHFSSASAALSDSRRHRQSPTTPVRNPKVLWQAGGPTALFMAGLGAARYGSWRDVAAVARVSLWGLVALIGFGIVMLLNSVQNGSLVYAIAGLVIFAGLTMFDFQRLRIGGHTGSAPLLMAASIFRGAINAIPFLSAYLRQAELNVSGNTSSPDALCLGVTQSVSARRAHAIPKLRSRL